MASTGGQVAENEWLIVQAGGTLQLNDGANLVVSPTANINFPIPDIGVFLWSSGIIVANGEFQNTDTTLGVVPSGVFVSVYDTTGLGIISPNYTVVEGTHTAAHVQIKATSGLAYKVIAWGSNL